MKAYASLDNIQLAMKLTHISKKSCLTVLHGVKITARHDEIEFTGTDLETYTKVTVPALVEEDGETVLDFQTVKKVVEAAKKNDRVMFAENSVKVGKAGASILAFDVDDFPGIPRLGGEVSAAMFPNVPVFAKQLGNALKTTISDESRKILTTISVSPDTGAARLVATDSYRLYVGSRLGMFRGEGSLEIPKTTAEIIMKAEKSLEEIEISRHDSWFDSRYDRAFMKLEGKVTCEVISRTFEGNYPNWKNLVAKDYDYSCDIERKTLDDGARFIKKMARSGAAVMLDLANGKVTCREQDRGEYSYDIAVGSTEDPHDRCLNVAYLIEALATSKEKTVTLKTLDSPHKPMVFENPEGDMILVMPVRAA